MEKYSVISLFSGAMGLDIGMHETSRFSLKAAVELERAYCDTIRANRDAGRFDPNLAVFQGDIAAMDPATILDAAGLKPGQLDVLVGGPPCQSFSTAGRRGATQDPRGTLLWEFLRFVDYMQPKYFLMENVRGLLSAALRHRPIAERPQLGGTALLADEQPGSVVRLFADDLQKSGSGYHMDCFEVNAVNYGAPQLRERALFIGNRFNAQVDFPQPTHGNPSDLEKIAADLFGESHALQPWQTLGNAIGHLNDPGTVRMDFSPRKKSFLQMVPPGSNWRSLPIEIQKDSMGSAWHAKGGRSGWWRRLSFDLPCPTLVTMPNHASTSLCHPFEVRALTLREYAAIQEFPSDWEFCGTVGQQYAQVGNAVPIRLGKIAGEVIARSLDKLASRNFRPYLSPPSHYRVIYVQSHVRTRQWFKGGETFVWDDGSDNGLARYAPPVTARREKKMAAH
ncbi:DNA cytosine methyltransferase [Rhodoblastus sp.]